MFPMLPLSLFLFFVVVRFNETVTFFGKQSARDRWSASDIRKPERSMIFQVGFWLSRSRDDNVDFPVGCVGIPTIGAKWRCISNSPVRISRNCAGIDHVVSEVVHEK